ncbi:hypothetical protein EEO29_09770 [Staphylococcus pseudintermedius]|uniref:hypothetical protein n=1 Tax=Staphylococcus pseudintermedius TaxID=283734 RepID=UPI001A0DE2CA|nr:hypothetical protein [Staphylococcus pseudintermedius]EGQ1749021.1 hypothetical protein [Staphylococcus pseudintermedius]EGQ2671350.1 hypothetical protein [Staphylococcus pseudintermedius]EGQ3034657.1 hypothetical protein [Staphylococcus pseudintermedius]EGQ3265704.1 hypothetical protein [Staphylococcus pseudintermedius]EGQ3455480.1 hypothetical protein [Staphylococcus pseudintermedius]
MSKVNTSFYLKPHTLSFINKLKIDKGFSSNAQVIEFLVESFNQAKQNDILLQKILKKEKYVDKQLQIIMRLNENILNALKYNPTKGKEKHIFDYALYAKQEIEKENRIKQLERRTI